MTAKEESIFDIIARLEAIRRKYRRLMNNRFISTEKRTTYEHIVHQISNYIDARMYVEPSGELYDLYVSHLKEFADILEKKVEEITESEEK